MFYCRLILLVTVPFTIATEYTITSSEALAVQTNLGYQLALLDDASTTGNWTDAKKIFLQNFATTHNQSLTLKNIGRINQQGKDIDLFTSYYESNDYASNFVAAAIDNTAPFNGAVLTTKMRAELIMKGVVLQGVTMGSINSLRKSIETCLNANLNADMGSPSYVDLAWAMFSAKKSQIALGEKRCPQFDTCLPNGQSGSPQNSKSIVNSVILDLFQNALKNARDGNCWKLQQQVELITSQLTIPVIQGNE